MSFRKFIVAGALFAGYTAAVIFSLTGAQSVASPQSLAEK